jgi:hypothetical protein
VPLSPHRPNRRAPITFVSPSRAAEPDNWALLRPSIATLLCRGRLARGMKTLGSHETAPLSPLHLSVGYPHWPRRNRGHPASQTEVGLASSPTELIPPAARLTPCATHVGWGPASIWAARSPGARPGTSIRAFGTHTRFSPSLRHRRVAVGSQYFSIIFGGRETRRHAHKSPHPQAQVRLPNIPSRSSRHPARSNTACH